MPAIHITDIEAAINHWRERQPAGTGGALAPPVAVLAEVYALMVYGHQSEVEETTLPAAALDAWMRWYDTMPDTPCIAICSTSQGDAICKGCGRTEGEVQNWIALSPAAKRAVWRRITLEHTALRFNRYADRARTAGGQRAGAPTAAAPSSGGPTATTRVPLPAAQAVIRIHQAANAAPRLAPHGVAAQRAPQRASLPLSP